MRQLLTLLLMNLAIFAASGELVAELVVVPGDYATTEGRTDNNYPFNIGGTTMRYQQVYASSQFSALTSPQLITSVSFRPDGVDGAAFSSTLTDIQINMSTTLTTPAGLSTSFADNIGADDLIVFAEGPLALSSSATGPIGGPKDFDIVVNLTTPYLYDPTAGNLLLDVRNYDGGLTTVFDAESNIDIFGRVYSNDGVTDLTGLKDSFGLVTQFTTQEVPEPGTFALLAGMLGLSVGVGRWRRGRAA